MHGNEKALAQCQDRRFLWGNILLQDMKFDHDRLNEIVDIILETVCTSRKKIRIAGDDYPAELVKSKFMKLDSEHSPAWDLGTIWAPLAENAPPKQAIKETPRTRKNIVFMRVSGVF